MKTKTWLYIGAALVLVIILYMVFNKKGAPALALTADPVKEYGVTEEEISREAAWLKNLSKATIESKAAAENRTFEQQLRLDAIWYARKNKGLTT